MVVEKQMSLKPQDLVVAVKLAANRNRDFLLAALAEELGMAISAVHGSIKRAEQARLLSRSGGSVRAIRGALKEFLIHGAKYAFPAFLGSTGRGTPTSVGAPALQAFFDQSKVLPPVWPNADGLAWGPTVVPLHSSVPGAADRDKELYDLLALLDAIRLGAARERELAAAAIKEKLA
ncbi:MAG: MarR family transcriptional regulator [Ramlibacter sp.]|nr:MarR family transcriptional regulator [Ramlibacter sp.]